MTHTLHRKGDIASLREDYVMIVYPAQGVNVEGSEEKMRQIWDVISHYEHDLANFGNMDNGNSHQTSIEIHKKAKKNRVAHAVFKDRQMLKTCLKELKDREFGLSVVISGLYEDMERICKEVGLPPHTVEHSLGIWGKTDRLPNENILEIITMCGHMMVSPNLVNKMIKEINEGKITCKEAARGLSKMCECGVFNPCRAEKVLRKMTN